jgi:hypothetical protein
MLHPYPRNLSQVTLHGKKDFADVIVKDLRWEVILDCLGDPNCNHRYSLRGRRGSEEGEGEVSREAERSEDSCSGTKGQ